MVCMFIKIKAHKDLLSCRLFHGKLKRQTVDIKKSAFGRFDVFFKTPCSYSQSIKIFITP